MSFSENRVIGHSTLNIAIFLNPITVLNQYQTFCIVGTGYKRRAQKILRTAVWGGFHQSQGQNLEAFKARPFF